MTHEQDGQGDEQQYAVFDAIATSAHDKPSFTSVNHDDSTGQNGGISRHDQPHEFARGQKSRRNDLEDRNRPSYPYAEWTSGVTTFVISVSASFALTAAFGAFVRAADCRFSAVGALFFHHERPTSLAITVNSECTQWVLFRRFDQKLESSHASA